MTFLLEGLAKMAYVEVDELGRVKVDDIEEELIKARRKNKGSYCNWGI